MNAMPKPITTADAHSAHTSANAARRTSAAASTTRAIVTDRLAPSRSGSRAPAMRTSKQTMLYAANSPPEPAIPTSRAWSGRNAENTANAAMPQPSTAPGPTAAGCKSLAGLARGAAAPGVVAGVGTATLAIAAMTANPAATANASGKRSSPATASPMIGPTPMPPNTATEK